MDHLTGEVEQLTRILGLWSLTTWQTWGIVVAKYLSFTHHIA
jgi:hypothetical protein